MTEEEFKALAKSLADRMIAHNQRLNAQADESERLLREYSEQLVRDVFGKETPATDPKPSLP